MGDSEKRTSWWNQEVKEAIRAKKDAFKVLLQDISSSDLQSQDTEVQKAATSTVKEIQGIVMIRVSSSVGFQLFFGKQSILADHSRLRGTRSSVTYSIKDAAGNILTDENEILL